MGVVHARKSSYVSAMSDLEHLRLHLAAFGSVVLGYSGGVDSAVLAVAARAALGRERFVAVIGRSASLPGEQHAQAIELAHRFDVPIAELETHELDDPRYLANSTDRCYFCKTELWTRLTRLARERGANAVIDGTNADDLLEHRPGARATAELGVRSPLAELGWGKRDVRTAARALGLPTWNAPAAPCLSSRVRYGLAITPERLRQVEAGEAYLRGLGVGGDLRVRHHDSRARIEVAPGEFARLEARWEEIAAYFNGLGFATVVLDPAGYRRGSLLAVLDQAS
jgi:uncharacterized protein